MNNLSKILSTLEKPGGLPSQDLGDSTIHSVLSFVFALAGIIALLMISIAAFRYVISRGDPENTKKAKNTILYAVVGLVIAMSGYGIVTFVFSKVK